MQKKATILAYEWLSYVGLRVNLYNDHEVFIDDYPTITIMQICIQ